MSGRTPRFVLALPRWQELGVYVAFGLLTVSGALWLVFHTYIKVAGQFGPEPHPAEHAFLTIHGVLAAIFLIVGGGLVPVHIRLGLRGRRNRVSGIATLTLMLVLACTGLALYYVGGEALRAMSSIIHWTLGFATATLLGVHAWRGRRLRKR